MDVIGGGLLVAVAAALWIAYLLPSWLRRGQYLATERNAVRLQQTLRILAETAETPREVRLEATAREVATQQRILREQEEAARLSAEAAELRAIAERRAAEAAAEAARRLAATAVPRTEPIGVVTTSADGAGEVARARRSLRRRRALCSLLLLIGLLAVIGGLIAAAFGASLVVAGMGATGMLAAVVALARLAKERLPMAAPAAVAPESAPFVPIEFVEAEVPAESAGWTPQPLPRPLHLSRGTIAATAMASIEAAAELKRAATEAEVARRVERLEPAVPSIVPAASTASAATAARADSPYARMGIIEDARPGIDDLDAVLRRRRQAG